MTTTDLRGILSDLTERHNRAAWAALADWLEESGHDRQATWARSAYYTVQDRALQFAYALAPGSKPRWIYTGDMGLEYGGVYVDLSTWADGYVDAVRVTDIDSGCGFSGAVLVERIVINGTDESDRIRVAMRSSGGAVPGATKEGARLMIAEALMSYGYNEVETSQVVQCEEDGPMEYDGWKVEVRLADYGEEEGASLEEYVAREFLDS